MKKTAIALLLLTIVLGSAASAEADIWVDLVGIYYDTEGSMDCDWSPTVGVRHLYLVLLNLTATGVNGFECQLGIEGPAMMTNFMYPPDAINVATPPTFIVGFGTTVPAVNHKVAVMEFDVIVLNADEPTFIFVDAVYFHSLPEPVPAYLTEEGTVMPLRQVTGYPNIPVISFNDHCGGLSTDETSWDALKSLYR